LSIRSKINIYKFKEEEEDIELKCIKEKAKRSSLEGISNAYIYGP